MNGQRKEADDLAPLTWLTDGDVIKKINLEGRARSVVKNISDEQKELGLKVRKKCFDVNVRMASVPKEKSVNVAISKSRPALPFNYLIFMAIESTPHGLMRVREIYDYIINKFSYFKTAHPKWKNSVRHNLSINKHFKRVRISEARELSSKKESFWCVDSEYRAGLVQALKRHSCKQNFGHVPLLHKDSAFSNGANPHLEKLRIQTDSEYDAVSAMLSLKSGNICSDLTLHEKHQVNSNRLPSNTLFAEESNRHALSPPKNTNECDTNQNNCASGPGVRTVFQHMENTCIAGKGATEKI